MEPFPVAVAEARERAAATRNRSTLLRAHLSWTIVMTRREMRRASILLAAAEQMLGLDLPWQEPDGELDRVLVVLDGGAESTPTPP
jgi:hypothetical protein